MLNSCSVWLSASTKGHWHRSCYQVVWEWDDGKICCTCNTQCCLRCMFSATIDKHPWQKKIIQRFLVTLDLGAVRKNNNNLKKNIILSTINSLKLFLNLFMIKGNKNGQVREENIFSFSIIELKLKKRNAKSCPELRFLMRFLNISQKEAVAPG